MFMLIVSFYNNDEGLKKKFLKNERIEDNC